MDKFWGRNVWLSLMLFLNILQVAAGETVPVELSRSESYKTDSYKQKMRAGSQSFYKGHYKQAKNLFEQALQLSPNPQNPSPTLYYNLGSTYYKLQQFDKSKRSFKHLRKNKKLGAIAYYNLALIENKQGNKLAAMNQLNRSKAASKDVKFSALVDSQLKKLKTSTVVKFRPKKIKKVTVKDWQAHLYLRSGYDSNIKFSPLEIASEQSGQFMQVIGLFDKVITGKGFGTKKPVLLFTSAVFISNYYSTDFNDYNLYDIGLGYLYPVDKWRNRIDLNVKKSTYGHNDYQRSFAMTLKTKYLFSDGDIFRLRYRYEDIFSLDERFNYLEGTRHRLRAGYSFRWPSDTLFLWAEYELNNRQNSARLNYSPTRYSGRFRYEKKFNATHKAYTELEYRNSNYDSTPFQNRLDNRASYTFAYVYDIAPEWQLEALWRLQINRSTESIYTYDRQISYLNVRKTF